MKGVNIEQILTDGESAQQWCSRIHINVYKDGGTEHSVHVEQEHNN